MATQRFTIKLTQLRCLRESDPGPSEPYLWVTYFALGPQGYPGTGPLALYTPTYDAFRTEFPNNVSAGSVVGIPPFIASASFDMDPSTPGPKLLGCVAVLMEQDETRNRDIVLGRIAYTKEVEKQLNALADKRIQTNDKGPLTEAEKKTIKDAVKAKVEDAIASHQGFFDLLFTDQDDALGFTYKIFPEVPDTPIQPGSFDFPLILTRPDTTRPHTDGYRLSGEVTVTAAPTDTVDLCAAKRAPLVAKRQQIMSLQTRVMNLQQLLQTATPQQKAAIIHEITETNIAITVAEAELPALEAALKACLGHFGGNDHIDVNDPVVNPGGPTQQG